MRYLFGLTIAFAALFPAPAVAQSYTEIEYTLTETSAGVYDFVIEPQGDMTSDGLGKSYVRTNREYFNLEDNTWCQGGVTGGGGPFSATTSIDTSTMLTNDTSGGSPDCSGEGTYYVTFVDDNIFTDCSADGCYYAPFYYDGDETIEKTAPDSVLGNETAITDVTATGTAATTTLDVDYTIDTTGYSANTRPDYIVLTIRDENINQVSQTNNLITPVSAGASSTSRTINESLADGTYYGDAVFWNIANNSATDYNGGAFTFTIESGNVTASNFEPYETITEADGDVILQKQPCGITNITGCIVNALSFVFVPSQSRLNQFGDLYDQLSEVKPFGYIVQVIELRGDLELTGDTSGQLDLIFMDDIFTPIRTGLVAILWVLFAFYLYNRFKSVDI